MVFYYPVYNKEKRETSARELDIIVTKNRLVTISVHLPHKLGISDGIVAIQYYQPDIDNLIIRIVKNEHYIENSEEKLKKEIILETGGELNVSVQFVDSISRNRLGKYRLVVSDVEPNLWLSKLACLLYRIDLCISQIVAVGRGSEWGHAEL